MNMPDLPRELLIRIFTDAGDAGHADELESKLLAALASFHPLPKAGPEAYWKEPGWFEHCYRLVPADNLAFDALLVLIEGEWHIARGDDPDDESEAVWNPSPGGQFLLPEVRWVQVLLAYPNPPAPDQEYLSS